MNKYNVDKLGYVDAEIDIKHDFAYEIDALRKQKNAVILAHYYQSHEIQDIADFVGDSLALSQKAATTKADIIVFAGVRFMAETAKILSPNIKVLIPDLNADCSLAASCKYDDFKLFTEQHPDHKVVTYVNTNADIKTLSYICCTSSNAVKVVNSIPADEPVIFAPDFNLGSYVKNQLNRDNMLIWNGGCHVHERFSVPSALQLKNQYPDAKLIAHPECKKNLLEIADFIGSTQQLLEYTNKNDSKTFIVATEIGIRFEMEKANSNKKFYFPAPYSTNDLINQCNFMKLITLKKLYLTLKYELPEINLNPETLEQARLPIERMLKVK